MNKKKQTSLNFELEVVEKKAIIIGQAPPKKLDTVPFNKTRLYKWLSEINISKYEAQHIFEFEALIDFFPGSDKKGDNKPSEKDIQKHIPTILNKINNKSISLVIPVGKMAIEYVLGKEKVKLSEVIGKTFNGPIFKLYNSNIQIVPLPHPSGLSTWSFKEENTILLKKALANIQNHL